MFLLWLYPLIHYLAIFTCNVKRVALPSSQDLTLLGFFPYTILFSQSYDDPDPPMFLFMKKNNFMALFHGWGSTTSRLELLWGGSLFFTIKFPEIAGSYSFFINLRRTNYTNTKIWSKERSIGPYIAKMLFPQRGFWLCYTTAIYKNIWTAYCAFQLCSYNRSVAGLRKI